jgi:hypothetical protein
MRWSSHEAALRKARVLRQRRYRASVHAER